MYLQKKSDLPKLLPNAEVLQASHECCPT